MSHLKLVAGSVTALILGAGAVLAAGEGTPDCAALAGTAIPKEEIGLRTTGAEVTASEPVAAAGEGAAQVPAHCLVSGAIHPVDPEAPDILFSLVLPAEWNGNVLMMGGGGFNGSIPNVTGNVPAGPTDQPTPLGRGYAVFASDSGHQANEFKSQDGSFALNQEAARNFGGDALKKTRDAAVFLVKQHYGGEIGQHYFAGGSTGGREALAAITRWPADWDGAIAWYPAWNDVAALLGGQHASRALAKPGAYPDTPARELIFDAAMAACDGLDGVEDGLISNQTLCNATFDPRTAQLNGKPVMCQGDGVTGCLTEAQVIALEEMNEGATFNFPLASGETQYPGYNVWGSDLGLTNREAKVQPIITFLALGTTQPATPMERHALLQLPSRPVDQVFGDPRPRLRQPDTRPREPGRLGHPHQRTEHAAGHPRRSEGLPRERRQAAAGPWSLGRAGEHPGDAAVLPAAAGPDGPGRGA